MFFEDEKDIIKEGTEIRVDDDGTVTWEDVLSTDEDLMSTDVISSDSVISENSEDELQIIENDDDIDDQELIQILNSSSSSPEATSNQSSYTASQNIDSEEDFDIDKQLANIASENGGLGADDGITPRKMEQKQKSSSLMPFLIIILIAALIGGGIYYYVDFYGENESLDQQTISRPAKYHEQVNENLNPEVLQQRQQEENIPVINEEDPFLRPIKQG